MRAITAALAAILLVAAGLLVAASPLRAQTTANDTSMETMAGMSAHMHYTDLQPLQPGDQARAAAVLAQVKALVAPYQDVARAEADGYKPNFPGLVRTHYHYSRRDNYMAAQTGFDVTRPTSLLYDRTPDGTFHLTGVMYTASRDATLAELDARVPLSIARWHEHLNICFAPGRNPADYQGPHPRFGNDGSIVTQAGCDAAGGRFRPQLLGWMVHIYPYAANPFAVQDMD